MARAVALVTQLGINDNVIFYRLHKTIIDSFGRHPNWNAILVRPSSE
jgi:uncharacterized protein (DUF924 family)